VTPGFDSQTTSRDSKIAVTGDALIRQPPRESETAVTGDAWIRQPDSPLGSQKLLSQVTRGFESLDSPLGSKKLLSRVTRGLDSQTAP
jgi:hypothetical protein